MNARTLLVLTFAALLLAGCGPSQAERDAAVQTQVAMLLANQEATNQAAQPAAAPTSAAPVTTTDPLLPPIPNDAACVPDSTPRVLATVTEIWSAVEIGVEIEGRDYEVRLIGLDGDNMPLDTTRQLVEGKQVLLIMDVTDFDESGRIPRYMIADGVFVNLELIRRGAAFASIEPPDIACEREFKREQR
ncbi:MAG: hypothetical protein WD751_00495 [Anaerolineales bacterium]